MFIRVADEAKHTEIVEIPVDGDADGSVSLSTLAAQFQGVSALKYRNSETSVWRGVRVVDGKLYHPDSAWDPNIVYVTVYSKPASSDIKRKGVAEQQDETIISSIGQSAAQNLDYGEEINNIPNEEDNDPNRRCVDLIVLGISYRSLEADVKKCFEAFGELIFCEIKRDANGQSRGFGFIRFKNYESQLAVINKRHFIDGRHVDVKIPDSKTNIHEPECARKIFVARLPDNITPDDLRQYFSKYGAIKDVYIPKPARSFAFVTFHDSNIVRTLFGTHIINGSSVTVGPAEPKNKPSAIGDYPSSTFKRAKPDHTSLRTLTSYGISSTPPSFHQQYGQSPNTDMMHAYFQQFRANTTASSKGPFSNAQQSYWSGAHDEAAAMWQQQQHYR
ncbi:unnamed protein product [Rotaria sp. Silwood2]|nr:unnamed protein product [Rotaria sp. Silwood2]CAF2579882.1 unnamed protein product [Rotaria sp. Silwood2]CAF2854311.1 unnamed protein product [Rotaria sp. Silwood2]CAF2987828.1 unnamed protein product [Rotaria sp. Silwood2]CAF4041098.1 unnamed protein product [Rotaria sp. Silwood2]